MKKTLLILALSILVFFCVAESCLAQQNTRSEPNALKARTTSYELSEFSCKQVVYDDEANTTTLLDSVSFKTPKFKLVKAGKVVHDQKTNKLTIHDCESFTFDGQVKLGPGTTKINIVEYTLGDDTVYIL